MSAFQLRLHRVEGFGSVFVRGYVSRRSGRVYLNAVSLSLLFPKGQRLLWTCYLKEVVNTCPLAERGMQMIDVNALRKKMMSSAEGNRLLRFFDEGYVSVVDWGLGNPMLVECGPEGVQFKEWLAGIRKKLQKHKPKGLRI